MKIFLSWSTMKSKRVSNELYKLLQDVFDYDNFEVFMSDNDIISGEDWYQTIKDNIEQSDCIIACITKENLRSQWLNFECGAIALKKEKTLMIPLLVDDDMDLKTSPLKQYQHIKLNKSGLTKLLNAIREFGGHKNPNKTVIENMVESLHEKMKKNLNEVFKADYNKYIEHEYKPYPEHIKKIHKGKVFLGTLMSVFNKEEDYNKHRDNIIKIVDSINKIDGIDKVYSPITTIKQRSNFDGTISVVRENFGEIKESEYCVFIYPKKTVSSVLIEMGYTLALNKKTIIFVKNRSSLPFMIRDADKTPNNIKIFKYTYYDDIIKIFNSNGKSIFY